jgi:hypothetical protein
MGNRHGNCTEGITARGDEKAAGGYFISGQGFTKFFSRTPHILSKYAGARYCIRQSLTSGQ